MMTQQQQVTTTTTTRRRRKPPPGGGGRRSVRSVHHDDDSRNLLFQRRSTTGSSTGGRGDDRSSRGGVGGGEDGGSSNNNNNNNDIQQSLSRTQTLLQQELQRISHVSTTINDDGILLKETMMDHETLNVRKAKRALSSYQRAELYEQNILIASICFFSFVVIYILWSRLFIRIPFLETTLHMIYTRIL